MNKQRKHWELTDNIFTVELQFFTGMVGEDGEKALFDMVRDELPTAEIDKSLDKSMAAVKRICLKRIFNFCDEGSQNQVRIVVRLLEDRYRSAERWGARGF